MQVLNHTYELNELLDSDKFKKLLKSVDDSAIINEWNDLRRVMWSGNGVVTPTKFVHNVHRIAVIKNKDLFTGYAQNDMPEFLLFMIECMHNSLSRNVNMKISGNTINAVDQVAVECYKMLQNTYSKEYSEIMDMFYGVYVSEIISKNTNVRQSIRPESYFVLNLPIVNMDGKSIANNLYQCFDMFTQPEYLEGDNAWYNENTKQSEDIKKQISFWNFPKVLIIVLQRFTPCGQFKINQTIDFPIDNLELSKYVTGYNPSSFVYDLFGICNHSGGTTGGHYTAYVRNAENEWYHYNDSFVNKVEQPNTIISPRAYCLFYRKKNNLV
jgi:ubiquitin carboxyl-terminal hydrolase 8